MDIEHGFTTKDFFKLKCELSDQAFITSLEFDGDDVVLPSKLAGPDIKWWIFVFGLKTTWTKENVDESVSAKNEETTTPSLCFYWRDKNKKNEPLKKKRKVLHDKCVEVVHSRVAQQRGFVRVRIELPYSSFVHQMDYNSTNDIHLDLDWKAFCKFISEDEAKYFKIYFN
jgi:hypothetical protein